MPTTSDYITQSLTHGATPVAPTALPVTPNAPTGSLATPSPQSGGVDKQALALTHAIALTESGSGGKPNYNAVGDNGTSHGAYQWHGEGHFASDAKAAGLDPNDFSPQNQDKVAYAKVKKLKDQGKQPAEIASIWNSGQPQNYENHSGTTVINGKTIHYDTPAYVQKVKSHYQALNNTPAYNPAPFSSGSVADLGNKKTPDEGVGQVVDDPYTLGSFAGKVGGFAKTLIEPELKGIASGVRAIQATPKVFKEIGSALENGDGTYVPQGADETMAKPLLGQKTGAGDSNLGNAATAGGALLQLLGLKAPGAANAASEGTLKGLYQKAAGSKIAGYAGKALVAKGVYDTLKHKPLQGLMEVLQKFL